MIKSPRPLTVECRAKLDSAASYNILVASDTKESAEHWSLYSAVGSGALSVYQPGRGGVFDLASFTASELNKPAGGEQDSFVGCGFQVAD